MKARTLFLVGAAAALLASPGRAVEMTAESPAMEMPKPGPEMENFKWMVGKWAVKETHEKSAFGPGGPGNGTAIITLGPGGFSHVMDYSSTGPNGKFMGKGMTAWDPDAKAYKGAWADNMTPGIMLMTCTMEGSDMVCSGENTMGGQKMSMRSRAVNPTKAGWTETMEMSMGGGPYQKMMTLEYKPAK